MDTDPDAPPNSTLDEQRPKGTPELQLASFGPRFARRARRRKERDGQGRTAGSRHKICRRHPSTQPSREIEPILPPLRFRRPPPIGMRPLRLNSRLPGPTVVSRPRPKASIQPSPRAPSFPRKTIGVPGTAPINAATMAVGALTGAFRRPEMRSQPPTPAAPADPGPSAPQSLLSRHAVRNILDTLRAPQDQTGAAPPAFTLSPERSRRDRLDQHRASSDDKRRGLGGRARDSLTTSPPNACSRGATPNGFAASRRPPLASSPPSRRLSSRNDRDSQQNSRRRQNQWGNRERPLRNAPRRPVRRSAQGVQHRPLP